MSFSRVCVLIFVGVVAFLCNCLSEANAATPVVQWVSQYNVPSATRYERPLSVSADSLGNIFLGGRIDSSGGFVAKYTSNGSFQWFQGIDNTFNSNVYNIQTVQADGIGNVYTTGKVKTTGVTIAQDVILQKFNSAGTQQWSKTFGVLGFDSGVGIAISGPDNIYVSGITSGNLFGPNAGGTDWFATKYNAAGTSQWAKQFGTSSNDDAWGITTDNSGNLLIAGNTLGSFPGEIGTGSMFLKKYDAGGVEQWTKRFGTPTSEQISAMAVDTLGNTFITGTTSGNFGGANAGQIDIFLSKLDASGTLQWTKQFGTSGIDAGQSLTTDGLGNVFLAYNTNCEFTSDLLFLYGDPAVQKYGPDGTLLWNLPLGTASSDYVSGISADGLGNLYATGYTSGNYGGPVRGGDDMFLVKIAEVPEPSSYLLIAAGIFGIVAQRRLRRARTLKSVSF